MTGRLPTAFRLEAAFWLLLLAGLLAGIGHETNWGRRWVWPVSPPEPSTTPFDAPKLTPPFTLNPPDKFIEIAMRPLFVPTRRPAPTLPDAPKQSMKKGQFILVGTMIVGESKFAQLIEKTGRKSHVIAEGKEINGIVIRQVSPTSVVLSQYDESEVVALQPPQAAAAATAARSAADGSSSPGQTARPPTPPSSQAPPPAPPSGAQKPSAAIGGVTVGGVTVGGVTVGGVTPPAPPAGAPKP